MSNLTRESIASHIGSELEEARRAAASARQFAIDCAQNNSISGSGERAVAEQQSDAWQATVSRLEKLHKNIVAVKDTPQRVSLASIAEVDLEGDSFTAVISDINCHLKSDEITVVTPESPLGKALINRASGDSFEYQVGKAKMSARVRRIF